MKLTISFSRLTSGFELVVDSGPSSAEREAWATEDASKWHTVVEAIASAPESAGDIAQAALDSTESGS